MSFARIDLALRLIVILVCAAVFSRAEEITVTGKLSRVMAVGGESTGWAIQLDSERTVKGKRLGSIEVQPNNVRVFEQLENKRVSATGMVVTRSGVETGERTVLRISSVRELKLKVNLKGSEWRLENLAGRWVMDNAKATLTFAESGKVSGNGSCNRFFGSAQIGDGVLKLGPLLSTRMACPAAVMDQESRYLKALGAAERYEVRDLDLLLYCKGYEKPLRFVTNLPAMR